MASTKPPMSSNANNSNRLSDPKTKITKQYGNKQVRKLKNGLLNTSIPRQASHLIDIAQRNSSQSSLLCLPGELRNKIWKFAVGGYRIDIRDQQRHKQIAQIIFEARPEDPRYPIPFNYIRPRFQLPFVCRQMYVEVSSLIYSHNTFSFADVNSMDRWIRNRPMGHLSLITSIDVPMEYMGLYNNGFRKPFCKKFPNIKRVGIDLLIAYFSLNLSETLEERKARVLNKMRKLEGNEITIEWNWGQRPLTALWTR